MSGEMYCTFNRSLGAMARQLSIRLRTSANTGEVVCDITTMMFASSLSPAIKFRLLSAMAYMTVSARMSTGMSRGVRRAVIRVLSVLFS